MTFPNVPVAPGVPQVLRDPSTQIQSAPALLQSDGVGAFGISDQPQWGLFKDGALVITADTILNLEYRQDWSLLDYPLEEGAFESYNKVQIPFDARVGFVSGGSLDNRKALLDDIAAAAKSLDLYDLVTPEATYSNVNITHYDYRRSNDRGVGLLAVVVWVIEIRVNATAAFANTQSPSGADPVHTGTVQPQAPSAFVTQACETTVSNGGGGW